MILDQKILPKWLVEFRQITLDISQGEMKIKLDFGDLQDDESPNGDVDHVVHHFRHTYIC